MNLRLYAKGKPCMVRVPGICQGGTETTVLAHLRQIGLSGGGMKAPDALGAWCCFYCHQAIDGQQKTQYRRAELRLWHLEGIMRTQNQLIDDGLLAW